MQDIDFDELDRAVSSVLGVTGRPSVVSSPAAPAPVFTNTSAPASEPIAREAVPSGPAQTFTPAFDVQTEKVASAAPDLEINPVPYQVPAPAAVPSSPVTPQVTRAPFNPASNVHAPSVSVPRGTVSDSSTDAPQTTSPSQDEPSEPLEPQPAFTPIETEPFVSTAPPQTKRSNGRFMDVVHPSSAMRSSQTLSQPLQTLSSPVTPPVAPAQAVPELPKAEPTYGMLTFEETDLPETAPLETPFLPDAKVQKRPLGAFSDVEEEQIEEPVVKSKPPMFEPALEISEEALIGATETADTDPRALQPVEVTPVKEKPAAITQPQEVARPYTASITQQYTEQLSSEPETSGSIFDTESYHQPLAHPQKKTSGVLIFVWILGLLVLGAGIGAAVFYFFTLKTL